MSIRAAIETVPPEAYDRGVDSRSLASRLLPSLKFAFTTEVHTYAFSIAANVLLSFIPFAFLLALVTKDVLHWQAGQEALKLLLKDALPSYTGNDDFIVDRLLFGFLFKSHKAQLVSFAVLAFTSTGVLLPLEVALNRIWGIRKNRGFLGNQVVSYAIVLCCALFAMLSVALTAVNLSVIEATVVRLGWMKIATALTWLTIKVTTLPAIVLVFFFIYYYLPNGKLPRRPLLLAAVLAGIVTQIATYVFMWLLPWLNFPEVYGLTFSRAVTIVFQAYVAGMVMLVGAYFAAYGVVRGDEAQLAGTTPPPAADGAHA